MFGCINSVQFIFINSCKIPCVVYRLNIKVSYLSHSEEVSTDAFEYIDCGVNSTMPRHYPPLD